MEQQKQKCAATSAGSKSIEPEIKPTKKSKPEITRAWIISGNKRVDVKSRLLSKVSISESGCWEYTGALDRCGYGKFKVNGRNLGAHKISYIIHKCDYDQSLCIMHSCDNPRCINPDHLSPGTHAENVADMISKGRMPKLKKESECRYRDIIIYQSARATAIQNGDKFYSGTRCKKHDSDIRITSSGECVYCRRDYNRRRRSINGSAIMRCFY